LSKEPDVPSGGLHEDPEESLDPPVGPRMGGANEHVAYAARSAHGLEGARGEDSAGIGEEPNGRTMFVHRAVERPHDVGGGRPCQSLERSTTCGGDPRNRCKPRVARRSTVPTASAKRKAS